MIALYADIRFAASEAKFTTSFAQRGLIAEHGSSWLLPRLVGPAHALDLLLSARKIGAAEAERLGLVNKVFAQAGFMDEVMAYARALADTVSPRSMAVIKAQIWKVAVPGLRRRPRAGRRRDAEELQERGLPRGRRPLRGEARAEIHGALGRGVLPAPFLRLRQVCLVAADLAREAEAIKAIFGLEECYRDPNVARYGLENVLFPVGTDFIEIVAPTRPDTAAGRFLARHGGRHGYMVIMDCDDPEARQRHCASDRRQDRQPDPARQLPRRAAASEGHRRRDDRIQPHRRRRRSDGRLCARRRRLAEGDPRRT